MPRLARLDAPGILHHVMGRGIERKEIFINDTDSKDLIDRQAALAEKGAAEKEPGYCGGGGCPIFRSDQLLSDTVCRNRQKARY